MQLNFIIVKGAGAIIFIIILVWYLKTIQNNNNNNKTHRHWWKARDKVNKLVNTHKVLVQLMDLTFMANFSQFIHNKMHSTIINNGTKSCRTYSKLKWKHIHCFLSRCRCNAFYCPVQRTLAPTSNSEPFAILLFLQLSLSVFPFTICTTIFSTQITEIQRSHYSLFHF